MVGHALIDAVIKHLSMAGRTAIVRVPIGEPDRPGSEPARATVRTIRPRPSRRDREEELSEAIEALPLKLRTICLELLTLPVEDERFALTMFRSWFRRMRRWRRLHEECNFFTRPQIPEADDLESLLGIVASLSVMERDSFWKMARRFREILDERRDDETDSAEPPTLLRMTADREVASHSEIDQDNFLAADPRPA